MFDDQAGGCTRWWYCSDTLTHPFHHQFLDVTLDVSDQAGGNAPTMAFKVSVCRGRKRWWYCSWDSDTLTLPFHCQFLDVWWSSWWLYKMMVLLRHPHPDHQFFNTSFRCFLHKLVVLLQWWPLRWVCAGVTLDDGTAQDDTLTPSPFRSIISS